jgi:hypothetical protein
MSTLIGNRVARLRGVSALFCSCLFLAAASPARAQPTVASSEWKAIQRVIAQQRAALIAGNDRKAFAYATPAIQAEFGDPTSFMAMVQTGYSALLTARYVEFLEGAVIDGAVIQPLRLIDSDNTVRVALYTMEKQKNGTWRISGCRIAPSMVQAT